MLKKLPVNLETSSDFILTSKLKMVLYMVTIMFLVFIIMNVVFSKMYSENVREVVKREFTNKVEQTCRYLDLVIEKVETTSEIIFTNQLVQDQALESRSDDPAQVLKRRDLLSFLQGIAFTTEEVNSIDLFLNKSQVLLPSDQGVYSDLDEATTDWYHQLQETDEIVWTDDYGPKLQFLRVRPLNQITMVRPLVSVVTWEKVGLIAINLEKRVIQDLLAGDSDTNNILINQSGKIIIASLNSDYDYGEIAGNIMEIREELKKGKSFGRINGINSVFVGFRSSSTGWELISFAPVRPSLMKISRFRNYVILFLLTNFIILSLLILLISKRMFDPVNKLISFMKKVEQGNLNVVIEDNRKDEFGYIYSNFNRMVANIRYLFQELYEEKLLKKDAELKLLQSKINPHFIYNIFNNMSWLLELGKYDDLGEMIDSVAKFHKTSLNYGSDFIKIADNVEQLKSYAKIQMIRFKNKFSCEFEIDQQVLEYKIPVFILQPLLENAICHGIEPKEDFGFIKVAIKQNKGNLVCTIKDNGVGIAKGKLNEIRKNIDEELDDNNRFFALANVNKRIKLHYGPEYGLKIISKKGLGTKVTVIMPLEELEGRASV
ncbi:MAG: sensor histidine kinase [Firmicutes bacterium]|nr:sensor histidine kinase [Bacillota bacterium]